MAAAEGLRRGALTAYAALQRNALLGCLSRAVPAARDRLLADPRYLFIVVSEVLIDSGEPPALVLFQIANAPSQDWLGGLAGSDNTAQKRPRKLSRAGCLLALGRPWGRHYQSVRMLSLRGSAPRGK